MWPTGSLPDRLGIHPVLRIQRSTFESEYPWTLRAPRTVSRTALAPRESIQMMAGPMASPALSTATVPDHCDVHPTPTTRSGVTPLSARALRADDTIASHQACGDCSAPPSSVSVTPTGANACAAMRPDADSSATFGPP